LIHPCALHAHPGVHLSGEYQAGTLIAEDGFTGRLLDINLASAEDFAKLPGIGPKLAARIVAFRQKHGPFRRVEDLLAIRGIGHKKWKAIRPYLRVESAERRK
jgi:competence protein ComEA